MALPSGAAWLAPCCALIEAPPENNTRSAATRKRATVDRKQEVRLAKRVTNSIRCGKLRQFNALISAARDADATRAFRIPS